VVLAVLVSIILDWKETKKVVTDAEWRYIPVVLAATFGAYGCASLGFTVLGGVFNLGVKRFTLFRVGMITLPINNMIRIGGAAGHSIRVALLHDRHVAGEDALAASIFHSYLYTVSFVAGLPVSLIYLFATRNLSEGQEIGFGIGLVVSLAMFGTATMVVFHHPFRAKLLGWIAQAANRVLEKDLDDTFEQFDASLLKGRHVFRTGQGAYVVLLILGDWALSILAVYFCFAAFGSIPKTSVLVLGYFAGVSLGTVSMIPGGLGVQDGSMAGVYHLLGFPFQGALLGTILFRILYYLVPAVISVGLYWNLLRKRPG